MKKLDGLFGNMMGGNCAILFFILIFLILFTDFGDNRVVDDD